MRFNIKDGDEYELLVEHKSKVITWDVSAFKKRDSSTEQSEWVYVNQYIKTLPDYKQDDLFNAMSRVKDKFDDFIKFEYKHKALIALVGDYFNLVDEEDIMNWVKSDSDIPVATNLKMQHDSNDKDPDKTYLYSDYFGLITLNIALRFMTGIWAEYLKRYHTTLGTKFKEYVALQLMDKTWLMSSTAVARLLRYIEAWINQKSVSESAVISGVSSFEFPLYVISQVLVRTLSAVSPTDAIDSGGLIVHVHKQVNTVLDGAHLSFDIISDKTKRMRGGSDGEQSNWSIAELYKITEPVPTGRKEIIRYFVNQVHNLASQLEPNLPAELLDECISNILNLPNYTIQEHAVILSQWTLRSHVPCRIFYELTKEEVMKLMALSQALLWFWEFEDLALLMTATIDRSRMAMGRASTRTRKRVRNDPMSALDEAYPYHKPSKSKPRDNNPAHKAISSLKDDLASCWIVHNAPPTMSEYAEEIKINENGSLIPAEIATDLAELFVKTEELY